MKDLNELRRLAGLPILEKHGHYEPIEMAPENDPKKDHSEAKDPGHDGTPPKGEDGKGPKIHKGGKQADGSATAKGGEGDAPSGDAPPAEGEEEPAFPEIVMAMASKLEGKTGDELVAMVDKLYNAGVQDGIAQAKAEMEGGEEGAEKKHHKKKDKEEGDDTPPADDEEAPADGDVPPPPVDDEEEEEKKIKKESLIKDLRRMINY